MMRNRFHILFYILDENDRIVGDIQHGWCMSNKKRLTNYDFIEIEEKTRKKQNVKIKVISSQRYSG